jgi:hypothetical protein
MPLDATVFLDEFRPFRRGEIALARKVRESAIFLHPRRLDLLRYALRLAQLSSLDGEPDDLVNRIGSFRLRLLQMLSPVLPTDPARIDPAPLDRRIPKVARLVEQARTSVVRAGLVSESSLDEILADKRFALILGGAAGSGYVFLGALERLEEMGIRPDYLVGCSVGSILAVIRARTHAFDLESLFGDVQLIRERGVFRAPDPNPRYGLPGALRIDLRQALGDLFADESGEQRRLAEMELAVDLLATGLGPGALGESREAYARMVDADLHGIGDLADLKRSTLIRVVGALVSLAMSRRVVTPLLLGSDAETAQLAALDGAGFSSAIPALFQYDVPRDDARGSAVLDRLFEERHFVGLVDGALSSLVPGRYAWEALEAGRIGTRNYLILALDAMAETGGVNAPLAPLLRTISATAGRDRAFWDLHLNFRNAPPFMDVFPSEARLRRAARSGAREFADTAELLRTILAPLPPWKELAPHAES